MCLSMQHYYLSLLLTRFILHTFSVEVSKVILQWKHIENYCKCISGSFELSVTELSNIVGIDLEREGSGF